MSVDDPLYDESGEPVLREGRHVRRAEAHFEAFQSSLSRLGLETAKEQPPAKLVTLLGVEIDLVQRRMRLASGKRESYAKQAEAIAASGGADRDEFISLLGKLNFAATCYPRGRQWLHAPWRAARARYRVADGRVLLQRAAKLSLRRWVDELRAPDHPGVPLASPPAPPPSDSSRSVAVYADAAGDSADAGFCA